MASISLKYKSKSGNLTAPGDVDLGAMIPIATTTLGSSQSTITFSSIPQNYEHLQIRGITAGSGVQSTLRFNSDSGNNYAAHSLLGDGSTVSAGGATSQTGINTIGYLNNVSNVFVPFIIDILDYSNTNKNKTVRYTFGWEKNASGSYIYYASGLWMNTSAINTITISADSSGSIAQYSSYALYGIKRAGA
jgi:hypothetical protein